MARLRSVLTLAALGAALSLGACAGGDDEEAAEDAATTATNGAVVEVPLEETAVEAIPETETPAPTRAPSAEEAAAINASIAAPPPAAALAEEEQMLDDAAATGMTSRLPTDGADEATAGEGANEAQPAE